MDENDEALRRYIDGLENWAEDEPPSAAEITSSKSPMANPFRASAMRSGSRSR